MVNENQALSPGGRSGILPEAQCTPPTTWRSTRKIQEQGRDMADASAGLPWAPAWLPTTPGRCRLFCSQISWDLRHSWGSLCMAEHYTLPLHLVLPLEAQGSCHDERQILGTMITGGWGLAGSWQSGVHQGRHPGQERKWPQIQIMSIFFIFI